MQTNIPSNLQSNIEQVRPVPDKHNDDYFRRTSLESLSSKENHL